MNSIHFSNIHMFLLLWLLPLVIILFLYAAVRRRKALGSFISPVSNPKTNNMVSFPGRGIRFLSFCLALTCIIIALTRPAWNMRETTVKRAGRDIVFMIDVSKSMLATDLMPNRLERAKLAIRDCVEKLQGDRIALVAFAGNAAVKCPLTQDYGFFLMMLDSINTDSIAMGGTLIGDALRTTLNGVFDNQEKQYKDIILITDGEDHESFPLQAARKIGDAGIRLLVIGLGDEKEGHRIPIVTTDGKTSFLKYEGQEVWSKLDGKTLRAMAEATPGGRYLPVATGTVDLGEVYLDLVAGADQKEFEAKTIKRYEEKFQIFLAGAILLLCFEGLSGRVLLTCFITLLPLLHPAPCPASVHSDINAGNKAYTAGEFAEAQNFYEKALADQADQPLATFNKGDSLFRQKKFSEAAAAFAAVLNHAKNPDLQTKSWFNRGNAHFMNAEQKKNLQEKLEELHKSEDSYQKALEIEPQLSGAGRNLEICRRKIREVTQELDKQQKQQQQKQSDDQQQKTDPKNDRQGKSPNPEKNQGKNQSQNKNKQQSGDESTKQQQSHDNKQSSQKQEQNKQTGQANRSAQSLSDKTSTDNHTQPLPVDKTDQKNTQVDQTVEAILNAEKKMQEMRLQRMRLTPDAVEKDW